MAIESTTIHPFAQFRKKKNQQVIFDYSFHPLLLKASPSPVFISTVHLKHVYFPPSLVLPPQTKPPHSLIWDTRCLSFPHSIHSPPRSQRALRVTLTPQLNSFSELVEENSNPFPQCMRLPASPTSSPLSPWITGLFSVIGTRRKYSHTGPVHLFVPLPLFLCCSHYRFLTSCLVSVWTGLPWSTDLRCPPGLPHQEVISFHDG